MLPYMILVVNYVRECQILGQRLMKIPWWNQKRVLNRKFQLKPWNLLCLNKCHRTSNLFRLSAWILAKGQLKTRESHERFKLMTSVTLVRCSSHFELQELLIGYPGNFWINVWCWEHLWELLIGYQDNFWINVWCWEHLWELLIGYQEFLNQYVMLRTSVGTVDWLSR